MADIYTNYSYTLRSAGPTPIGPGSFIQQTFGIDKSEIKTYVASTIITTSTNSMTGAGGNLISANWQRLPYVIEGTCTKVYNGTTVKRPDWLDKDVI